MVFGQHGVGEERSESAGTSPVHNICSIVARARQVGELKLFGETGEANDCAWPHSVICVCLVFVFLCRR